MPIYRGRFAPTPSGPLHFGSLVAAMASYLEARTHDGVWLVRMEDVDPPRVVAGAAEAILKTLAAYGFEVDETCMWQSRRTLAYQAALQHLMDAGYVYACTCSRKTLAQQGLRGVDGLVYPGTCRMRAPTPGAALRFRVPRTRIVFDDAALGRVACNVAEECGDFVLRRADGVFAYQLAVVVDDAAQGVTHVVRGADLLASTPRQIVLQQALGYTTPAYLHVPVVLDAEGCKLSKQTLATPLLDSEPLPALQRAARFLGMEVKASSQATFWDAAQRAWRARARAPVCAKREAVTEMRRGFSRRSCS